MQNPVTRVSHQSPACRSVAMRFKLPTGSFAAPICIFYFIVLKSVFVDKFGYPCTIDDLFDLEKKKNESPYHIQRVSS